jgi:hypothetical protein
MTTHERKISRLIYSSKFLTTAIRKALYQLG